MPKFDLDKDESVYSTLEFVIDGKTFKIVNCSKKAIDSIADMELHEQFAVLCNVDPKEIEKLNFFKLRGAMAKFYDSVMKPVIAEAESLVALRDKVRAARGKTTSPDDKQKAIEKEKKASRGGRRK
jgi:hypothetical protein